MLVIQSGQHLFPLSKCPTLKMQVATAIVDDVKDDVDSGARTFYVNNNFS